LQIVRFEQVGRQPLLVIAAYAAVGSANLDVPKLRFCSLKLSTIRADFANPLGAMRAVAADNHAQLRYPVVGGACSKPRYWIECS